MEMTLNLMTIICVTQVCTLAVSIIFVCDLTADTSVERKIMAIMLYISIVSGYPFGARSFGAKVHVSSTFTWYDKRRLDLFRR